MGRNRLLGHFRDYGIYLFLIAVIADPRAPHKAPNQENQEITFSESKNTLFDPQNRDHMVPVSHMYGELWACEISMSVLLTFSSNFKGKVSKFDPSEKTELGKMPKGQIAPISRALWHETITTIIP